jgi:hypothetical protein
LISRDGTVRASESRRAARRPEATADELRDVLRRVLEVSVHRHDRLPVGADEAGVHRGMLAVVALQPHRVHARVGVVEAAELGECPVGRAVVDEDRLPVPAVERRVDPPVQLADGTCLVQHGDDD